MDESRKQTLLIIDDDPAVLNLLCRILGKEYRVIPAASGQDALRVFEAQSGEVDLAISDVVMPQLSGPDLVDRLRAAKPDLRVVFMSGFANSALVRDRIVGCGIPIIPKPFSIAALLETVRQALTAERSRSAGT